MHRTGGSSARPNRPPWMRSVAAAATKDLRRLFRDRLSLSLWVGIPLLVGALVTAATEGREGLTRPRVWLVDADESPASRRFCAEVLGVDELGIELLPSPGDQAQQRVRAEDGAGVLTIPPGFGAAFLAGQPLHLALEVDPRQELASAIATEVVRELTRTASRALASGARPPSTVSLRTEAASDEPLPTLAFLLLPGLVILAVAFVSQGSAEDFWEDLESGTLRRALASPAGITPLVAGKILASTTTSLLVGLLSLGAGFLYHGLPLSRLPLALVWCGAASFVATCALSWLAMQAPSRRAATVLSNSMLLPLLMIGGSFFPLAMLPPFWGRLGAWTPNGWAVARLLETMRAELPGTAARAELLVAVLVALALAGSLVRTVRSRARASGVGDAG